MSMLIFLLAFLLIVLGGVIATMGDILPRALQQQRQQVVAAARREREPMAGVFGRSIIFKGGVIKPLEAQGTIVIPERTARLNLWRVRLGLALTAVGVVMLVVYFVTI